MSKVKLELTPYTAIAMLAFVREWVNEDTKNDPLYKPIQDACDEYEKEIVEKMTPTQLEDATMQNEVDKLTGKADARLFNK